MSTALVETTQGMAIERALIVGDLSQLKPEERLSFYKKVCESVGLNPLTKPFEYVSLNNKLTLYARKDATDQLRNIHNVSITILARELVDDCYVVTARATMPSGRTDESIGAVNIANLKGEAKANAMMKAETKAKRRVTLSICGLGMLDESEIETIPNAKVGERTEVVTDKPISFKRDPAPNPNSSLAGAKGEVVHQVGRLEQTDGAGTLSRQEIGSPQPPLQNRSEEPAVKSTAAVNAPQAAPVVNEPSPAQAAVEMITPAQQANFHRECRKAARDKMKADDLTYGWLKDNGYVSDKGEPTAAKIPAAGWLETRNKAARWVSVQ